ncbi:MAG: ribonuclease P protein component [Chloroflexota bacterium]|nr:ribonuclease P protein component [Chloroflexota bacterium]
MLPRRHRLTRKASFDAVFARGSRWTGKLVTIRTFPNGLDAYRLGLAVSKAVGNAVVRNRVKRRLREIVRGAGVAPGYDVVVVARPSAADSSFAGLRADVMGLLRRAGVCGATAEQGEDR